jgi:hypothetical protein
MRAVRLLCFVAFAGLLSVLVTAGSAPAQGIGTDPTSGTAAVHARSDGAYSPPRLVIPTFTELKLSLRLAFARTFALSLRTTPVSDSSDPALVARRRSI